MSTVSTAPSADAQAKKLTPQEAQQRFQQLRSEMQSIAQKISEIENERDEHRLVIETLQETEPSRKCFRLVGGILVERTVQDVLPALQQNIEGLKQVLESLMKQYKGKEEAMQTLQRTVSG